MSGRDSLTREQEALAAAIGVEGLHHPEARYNIAPTQRPGPRTRWGRVGPHTRREAKATFGIPHHTSNDLPAAG